MPPLQGVALPVWAPVSPLYNRLFNMVSGELGLPLQSSPTTGAHILNAGVEGVLLTEETRRHYGLTDDNRLTHPLFTRDVQRVAEEIERRRLVMVEAGMRVFPIVRSGTYTHHKTDLLNAAEREFASRVADPLYEASQAIYGHQAMPLAGETLDWVRSHSDPFSRYHFERTRGSAFAVVDTDQFPNAKLYANALPWFPTSPTYNNMWPADLSEEELAFISQNYPADDPILMPYTKVLRISPEEAGRLNAQTRDGTPVEWARRGRNGNWYRVVNMAFDDELRPHFLKMAMTLRENAEVSVDGAGLHPQFRDYVRTAADCLESGDFIRLLQADLGQAEGPLFLTLFPHEGYWDDGVKYPLIFSLGVRDDDLLASAAGQGYVVNWLGQQVERAAREAGLENYRAPAFEEKNLRQAAVFFWALRTGGFMRAFTRDPGGHDYPKRDYPGVEGHRNVILQDVMETWAPLVRKAAEVFFGAEVARHVTFWGMSREAFLHEAGHGAQIRQNVTVGNGKTFSEALKDRWGVLVEPWADAGSILGHYQLFRDGKITEDQLRSVVTSGLIYNIVRLHPRAVAKSDDVAKGGPHIAGSSMYLGWLFRHGALAQGEGSLLRFDEEKIYETTLQFFDRLTTFAARGDYDGFLAFVDETIGMLPEPLEAELIAGKKALPSYTILDRGDLAIPAGYQRTE